MPQPTSRLQLGYPLLHAAGVTASAFDLPTWHRLTFSSRDPPASSWVMKGDCLLGRDEGLPGQCHDLPHSTLQCILSVIQHLCPQPQYNPGGAFSLFCLQKIGSKMKAIHYWTEDDSQIALRASSETIPDGPFILLINGAGASDLPLYKLMEKASVLLLTSTLHRGNVSRYALRASWDASGLGSIHHPSLLSVTPPPSLKHYLF